MIDSVKFKGYTLAFVASATYGLNPLFALPLIGNGMATNSILLFRYLMALPILMVVMAALKADIKVGRRELLELAGMGVLVGVSSLALFESYRYMDAGVASTLLFVYPVMVALIMAGFFGERLTAVTWICLALALGGIAMFYYGDSSGATLSLTGTILVFVSALSYAVYIVAVNKSSVSHLPSLTVTFYCLFFGLMVFIVKALFDGDLCMPSTIPQWGGIMGLALLSTVLSFFCTNMAIVHIGSTPTAILGSLEPLTAVVVGITVFGETMSAGDWLGFIMIIAAVTLVVTRR